MYKKCAVVLVVLVLAFANTSILFAEESSNDDKPDPPTIEKAVNPDTAQAGDLLTYTITVTNPNDEWVGEHIVRDLFPANRIRPYMNTLTVVRDGVTLTSGQTIDDYFLLYDYCLTTGFIDLLFYGLPPLSETVITVNFRALPGLTLDIEVRNDVTLWFAIWTPGDWDPDTGSFSPGHRDPGDYPVGECYAILNLQTEDDNDDGNDGGGGSGGGGGGDSGGDTTPTPPRPPVERPRPPLPPDPPGTTPSTPTTPPTQTPPSDPIMLPPPPPIDWPPYWGDENGNGNNQNQNQNDQSQQDNDNDYHIYDPSINNNNETGTGTTQPGDHPTDGIPELPIGTKPNPQTSDDFTLMPLFISGLGLMLSLGVVVFLLLKLRKNKEA